VLGFGLFFSLLILYTAGSTPWMKISPSQGRYLQTGQRKHRINTQTSIPQEGFKPITPKLSGRRNFFHVSDYAAAVIGSGGTRWNTDRENLCMPLSLYLNGSKSTWKHGYRFSESHICVYCLAGFGVEWDMLYSPFCSTWLTLSRLQQAHQQVKVR
jgi:hypothetical protein